jgi:hypothetical protein
LPSARIGVLQEESAARCDTSRTGIGFTSIGGVLRPGPTGSPQNGWIS